MNEWIVWKLGNGYQIRVGEDPLIGSTSFHKLSNALVNFTHDKGIFYLTQTSRINGNDNLSLAWKYDIYLGLLGQMQEEWKGYTIGLNSCGFQLIVEEDSLLWDWNGMNGEITTKLALIPFFRILVIFKKSGGIRFYGNGISLSK